MKADKTGEFSMVAKPHFDDKQYKANNQIRRRQCSNLPQHLLNLIIRKMVSMVAKPHSYYKKYKQNIEIRREWSNLPPDLLDLIFRKLYFMDRIQFSAVCKDWHVPIGNRPVNELPWIMSYTLTTSNAPLEKAKIMLSDPAHKKTHTISNFAGIEGENMDGLQIYESKGGWLLLINRYIGTALYLYSPFTNNVIILPPISCSITAYLHDATFSSTNPMSPDCVFVVAHCCEKERLGISMHKNGDIEWRTIIFDGGGFKHKVCSLVCTDNGVCYILFQWGQLGAFCVESQEWRWLVDSLFFITLDYSCLLESNGVLLLVNFRLTSNNWYVFRYDENERGWIQQKTLGDRALFTSFSSGSYVRPTIGDTIDLADKIFYTWHDKTRVYSLKDGKSSGKTRAYDWIVNGSLLKIWIETPY